MVRDPFAEESAPEVQAVLDVLDDPDCRAIIRQLDTPMTASEIADACNIPVSTTYRKLDLLSEASLLEEQTEVRADGHHTTRYRPAFAAIWIALDADREFEVRVAHSPRTADEQLAQLWSEVRKET
jgi:DNA-binding IclR family transcriptional regulator